MLTLPELRKEIIKQKGETMDKYDGLYLFFEEEINERYGKEKAELCEKVREDCIHNSIYSILNAKYDDKSVSRRLREKIDAINYYPALEDIQVAAVKTPSLAAFGRKVNEIIRKYEIEIKETTR